MIQLDYLTLKKCTFLLAIFNGFHTTLELVIKHVNLLEIVQFKFVLE